MKSKIEYTHGHDIENDGEQYPHRDKMSGEEVFSEQERQIREQCEAQSELTGYLMNSLCTPGARVEHPVNELEHITTLVTAEHEEDEDEDDIGVSGKE